MKRCEHCSARALGSAVQHSQGIRDPRIGIKQMQELVRFLTLTSFFLREGIFYLGLSNPCSLAMKDQAKQYRLGIM